MEDFEQQLRAKRLAVPSEDLDRRIDGAFHAARAKVRTTRPFAWWWLAAAAAVGAAAVLLVFAHPQTPAAHSAPVVYRVEAKGRLRDMLLNPDTHRDRPTPFVARAVVP